MNNKVETKQLRRFGLIVGGFFGVIGLWPALFRGEAPRLWALAPAGLLIVAGLILPKSLEPAYRVWMAVGDVLGWVNTRIILGVIFYGLFVPMGLLMRLFGKASMRHTFDHTITTYRVLRQPRNSSHMTRQF